MTTTADNFEAWKAGSKDITKAVVNHDIPLCPLAGHNHWGRGVIHSRKFTFVNASSLWPGRKKRIGVSLPVIIDYGVESRKVISIDCVSHVAHMKSSQSKMPLSIARKKQWRSFRK
jgi:hypothetical protein